MHCKPGGLFVPIEGSQISRKSNMVYDTPDQIYALTEKRATGIITTITKCYVYDCIPGQGGCYAPRCPNNPKIFTTDIEVRVSGKEACFQVISILLLALD